MPLDPMMTNALLGTFKTMVDEIQNRNLNGEDVDKMNDCYNRMVELTEQHSDMNAFNGQVVQENLYAKFSEHYGKALTQKATSDQNDNGYDDVTLLKQVVDALKNSIQEIIKGKEAAIAESKKSNKNPLDQKQSNQNNTQPKKTLTERPKVSDNSTEIDILFNFDPIITAISGLVTLGEQDRMTLPRFLRIQIEKGMDKAVEGMVLVKDGYDYELGMQKAMRLSPYHIKKAEEKLALYDELASQSQFNIPNSDELTFGEEKIDYKHQFDINKWDKIVDSWQSLIDDLSHWSLSYTSVAPFIEPWNLSDNPKEAVITTQNIQPGIFKERLRLFEKYFGISFLDIFNHPTFKWNVEYSTIGQSQEYIEFLCDTIYPQCKPFTHLNAEAIQQKLSFYNQKRESNPDYAKPLLRFMAFYDNKFGEGRYLSKYDAPDQIECNAKPWG